jgi:hypothetical protein
MTGPGLLDLPVEILIKIIQLAIPPMVLPEDLHVVGWMTNLNERAATIAIMGVCHKFRNLLLKTRPLTGYASTGQKFTFDVERGTLLVHGMNIPDFLKTHQLPNLHCVRLLASFLPYTIGWASYDYLQRTIRGLRRPWAIDVMSHDPLDTAYEENLPFEISFTVAQELGSLWEIGLVIETAPGWYIDSFQQFGPQPEHRRIDPASGSPGQPIHHTGPRWTNDRFEYCRDRYEIPMIGLHGYSKTRRDRRNPHQQEYSQGGQWAGFRVYLETQEVEFRPLTWDEVEHLAHHQQQPGNEPKFLQALDPEFVSQI